MSRRRVRKPTRVIQDSLETTDRVAVLLRQARRQRRRGDHRKAMLLFREASHLARHEARILVWYGLSCAQVGRTDDARRALSEAAWLRKRAREHRRLEVTERLLDDLVRDVEAA